jgi:hypothetical protein
MDAGKGYRLPCGVTAAPHFQTAVPAVRFFRRRHKLLRKKGGDVPGDVQMESFNRIMAEAR